jgi:hypothetical protein
MIALAHPTADFVSLPAILSKAQDLSKVATNSETLNCQSNSEHDFRAFWKFPGCAVATEI